MQAVDILARLHGHIAGAQLTLAEVQTRLLSLSRVAEDVRDGLVTVEGFDPQAAAVIGSSMQVEHAILAGVVAQLHTARALARTLQDRARPPKRER